MFRRIRSYLALLVVAVGCMRPSVDGPQETCINDLECDPQQVCVESVCRTATFPSSCKDSECDEKVIGGVDWLPVGDLPESDPSRICAKGVAELTILREDQVDFCTAFLVSADALLTNHHCIDGSGDGGAVLGIVAWFDWPSPDPADRFECTVAFAPDGSDTGRHDFAVLSCPGDVHGPPGERYPILPISSVAPRQGQDVYLMHYNCLDPGSLDSCWGNDNTNTCSDSNDVCYAGRCYRDCNSFEKLRSFGVVVDAAPALRPDRFEHDADTYRGSSGGPVLDISSGMVIGMHHRGCLAFGCNLAVKMTSILDYDPNVRDLVDTTVETCQMPGSSCNPSEACCDSEGGLRPDYYTCRDNIDEEFRCSESCGGELERRVQLQRCSGSSGNCEGEVVWGRWNTDEMCAANERCDSGSGACIADQACARACDLAEACCDSSGVFRPENYTCDNDVRDEFRCTTGRCGSAIERRSILRKCSGNSGGCDGETVSGSWNSHQSCSDGELCAMTSGMCTSSELCIPGQGCTGLCGDVDQDGDIDQADVDIVSEVIIGNVSPGPCSIESTDTNNDGEINIEDLLVIVNYLNGNDTRVCE